MLRLRRVFFAQRNFDVRFQPGDGRAQLMRRVRDEAALVGKNRIQPCHQVVDGRQERMHFTGHVGHGNGTEVEMGAGGDGLLQRAQWRESARNTCPQHDAGDGNQQQLREDDADQDLVGEHVALDERLRDLDGERRAAMICAADLGDAHRTATRLAVVRERCGVGSSRRQLGIAGYWSLAGYAKRKVKTAVSFIYDFEESVVRNVKSRGLDGVVCGHIHAAAIKQIDGVAYINCGDWVDSCTAIVEHSDGRMELIDWGVKRTQVPQGELTLEATDAWPAQAEEREAA